jgi:hypothetical protein
MQCRKIAYDSKTNSIIVAVDNNFDCGNEFSETKTITTYINLYNKKTFLLENQFQLQPNEVASAMHISYSQPPFPEVGIIKPPFLNGNNNIWFKGSTSAGDCNHEDGRNLSSGRPNSLFIDFCKEFKPAL